jgi:hypothetical protein
MKNLFVALMFFVSSIANAQTLNTLDPNLVYTTGNVVQPTVSGTNTTPWVNGVYQDSLTCWAWGNPGYCGPNAIVRPGNNINFSFGTTNLYQMQLISNLLPNSGTGLRVNGYNFSFTAKNGNGWDDGRIDYLNAYVSFYDSKGSTVFNQNYNLTYKFDWTNFNFSENFTTPFATKDLGSVQYGFVGRDNNGWAGPYGPEVYNVSFSLKYSVDPCFNNPLYSSSCPGFADALAKLTPPLPTNTTETVTSTNTTNATLQAPTTTVTQSPVAESSLTTVAAPSVTLTSTVSNKETTVNSNGVSIGLSVVARNQQREQSIAMQAAQSAVAAAEQTAQQAQQESVNIAQSSSLASSQTLSGSSSRIISVTQRSDQSSNQIQTTQSSSFVSTFTQPNIQTSVARLNDTNRFGLTNNASSDSSIVQSTTTTNLFQEQTQNIQTQVAYTLLPPTQQPQQVSSQAFVSNSTETTQVSQPLLSSNQQSITSTFEMTTFESQRLLTDRTNPINQIIEGRGVDLQTSTSMQQKASVNTNASDNEIAGGVNISRMATAPVGYNQYLNLVIADAAFYAPKEIYKGQKTVDNVRALRQMSSDRLHQEMVNQQYRR